MALLNGALQDPDLEKVPKKAILHIPEVASYFMTSQAFFMTTVSVATDY